MNVIIDKVTEEMLKEVMKKRRVPSHKTREFLRDLIEELYREK
jgi:hypothetical protein